MRLIAAYAGLPIVTIAIFFACVGAWAEFLMVDMLNALFRSAVGKRRGQYLSSCTRLQRVFRTYILKITAYRRRLSRYLVFNRLTAWIGAAGMVLLLGIDKLVPGFPENLIRAYAAAVVAAIFLPPIVLSFVLTRYRGGHPHYEFDLSADFIGPSGIETRRELLRDKKKGLLLTPEQFAALNQRKAPTSK